MHASQAQQQLTARDVDGSAIPRRQAALQRAQRNPSRRPLVRVRVLRRAPYQGPKRTFGCSASSLVRLGLHSRAARCHRVYSGRFRWHRLVMLVLHGRAATRIRVYGSGFCCCSLVMLGLYGRAGRHIRAYGSGFCCYSLVMLGLHGHAGRHIRVYGFGCCFHRLVLLGLPGRAARHICVDKSTSRWRRLVLRGLRGSAARCHRDCSTGFCCRRLVLLGLHSRAARYNRVYRDWFGSRYCSSASDGRCARIAARHIGARRRRRGRWFLLVRLRLGRTAPHAHSPRLGVEFGAGRRCRDRHSTLSFIQHGVVSPTTFFQILNRLLRNSGRHFGLRRDAISFAGHRGQIAAPLWFLLPSGAANRIVRRHECHELPAPKLPQQRRHDGAAEPLACKFPEFIV
mmetsp:Transcript_24117/g.67118  ORF Transcript_24117/g.67118 Transcript_24117/m.67118 type:complete len:399 (-) Transcript_24117:165-1361(-)